MRCLRKGEGFTLIEMMIVIIIIGILASFSLPLYTKAVERSRQGEAYQMLGALRGAMIRYYHEHLTWSIAWDDLDVDFRSEGQTGTKFFNYQLFNPEDEDYPWIVGALRNSRENPGYGGYVILLYLNGDYEKQGVP